VLESLLSLLDERKLDTSLREERNDWLLAFSNDEDVVNSCGEGVSKSVLDVSDIEGAGVLLDVLEDTDSTDVVTTNGQNLSAIFELDQTLNFSSLEIQLLQRDIKYKYFQKRKGKERS
jgi:hypothetical protein